MIFTTVLLLAVLANAAIPNDCAGRDRNACSANGNAGIKCKIPRPGSGNEKQNDLACQSACAPSNVTLLSQCSQCSIDLQYGAFLDAADSSMFANEDAKLVDLDIACASAGYAWAATPTLTEPAPKTPLPPSASGRQRSCKWLCRDYEKQLYAASRKYICFESEYTTTNCSAIERVCNQDTIDALGACFQCRFTSANSGDFGGSAGKRKEGEESVLRLSEVVSACSIIGTPVTQPLVYTQFPVPTNEPSKALQLSMTTTFTPVSRTPTQVTGAQATRTAAPGGATSGAGRNGVAAFAVFVAALAAYVL
ncbi:uncharacterized protein LOC62_03G005112 [Vanrija pseudolonga]|uniref:Uncharacterized protein n=1 Tax=Vanrija pseudolonga TaxID=143232 RepID=A0AAF0Y7N3_9TREE|nr:hypothetical protein LOC62_03G005112 [Vanrija pseudolonga]